MSSEEPGNPISSTLTEGQKKKRGRAKKQAQEDRRLKASKIVTVLTGATAEPSAGKRPRERPHKCLTFTVNQPKMNGWVTLANALGLDMLSPYNPGKSIFHLLSRAACGHLANKRENSLCFKR
uniref:Uncharacterized protein n=1 Tax=Taeniopygia guttata TaxID=59729 RepID=A0A674GA34_TAEGU